MSQKTNLNISPYYDDFDKDDQFYKVLFKPGFPVQARELSTLQSILQNQVEQFGTHMFKDGSMVVPGGIAYDPEYYSMIIEPEHLGVPVISYLDELKNKKLKSEVTGVQFTIDDYLYPEDSDQIEQPTIFVKYLSSGPDNVAAFPFDGENIIVEETFVYGNTTITAGQTVLKLVDVDSHFTGSAAKLSAGVYFIRGNFVEVPNDKIVLDPYNQYPSYRVGLTIDEQIITAKDDPQLYDNARGFSNFAAPGADRLKIKTELSKKSLTDFNDTNFIELLRIDDGQIKVINNQTEYNLIRDYFAKRTYEESGNYSLDEFRIDVLNSLNDGFSPDGGVYRLGEETSDGNIPNDDLMCVKVSSGKAYVKGYDISLDSSTILDVQKPRDVQEVDSALIPYQMGTIFKVNHASGVPAPNINDDTATVELYNKRTTIDNNKQGDKIGEARIYSFAVSDASYENDTTEWDLHLFDVQIFTKIELNVATTASQIPVTSFVRGVSSGASGFASVVSSSYNCIHLSNVTGQFMAGEQVVINENTSIIRSIKSIETFGIQDVKGIFQNTSTVTGYGVSFTADTVLQRVISPNFSNADKITITGAGATTNGTFNFVGVSTGTILRYTPEGETIERFNRIETVSADGLSVTLSAVPTIAGICNGALNTSKISTTFAFGVPKVSLEDSKGLYSEIENKNVADVFIDNASLIVGKNITGESTNSDGVCTFDLSQSGLTTAFYESFDEERYSVHYSDKTIEPLTPDQFVLSNDGQSVTINGLKASESNIVVSTTLRKQGLKSKQKNYLRSERVTVESTAVGINTALTGLTQSSSYGLRVEDKEISLNKPDAVKIIGVFESLNDLAPTLDKFVFPSGLSLDSQSVLGELLLGDITGAVAQIVGRVSATEVEVVMLSSTKFAIGEVVLFIESQITSTLQDIVNGNHTIITNRFELDRGQREQYYDYSRIVRKSNFAPPSRKLLIIYDRFDVPTNDRGDIYTVNSYPADRFGDIPHLKDSLRASDTIDFRPRVGAYGGTGSPFAFSNRTFDNAINPSFIVSPNESSIIGYNFYLPRKDKVILGSDGAIGIMVGESSLNPKEPSTTDNTMELGVISLPAYLYSPDDAIITLTDNVRFTMRDIGKLEDRIENLEITSSLSLLELDTKTLQIQDADGLTRFKTGFFVDDFKNTSLMDIDNIDCNVSVTRRNRRRKKLNGGVKEGEENIMTAPAHMWSVKPELALDTSLNSQTADFSADLPLLDPNVRKTGDLITLDYDEIEWLGNPLASRVENVNPFNLTGFYGKVKLDPANDTWIRNVEIDGGKKMITGTVDRTYVEKVQLSSKPDDHIRSRNVGFAVDGLRPVTRFYPFFDKTSGIDTLPKLIEMSMVNGIFSKGEKVEATVDGKRVAIFRIIQPDHKEGDINSPTKTFNANPYDTTSSLGTSYSASSTVLNVDINSLIDEAKGEYYGYIPNSESVTLLGQTSKAQATVTNVRLVADTFGDLYGSFFFRNPLSDPPPSLRFKTGTSTFKLTSSIINEDPQLGSELISSAVTEYVTSGKVNTIKSTNVTIRTPPSYYYNYTSGGGQRYVITNRYTWDGRYKKYTVNEARALQRSGASVTDERGTYFTGQPSNTVSQGALSRRYSASTFGTGIPSGSDLKAGSFGISVKGAITAGLNRIGSLFGRKSPSPSPGPKNQGSPGSPGPGGPGPGGPGPGGPKGGNQGGPGPGPGPSPKSPNTRSSRRRGQGGRTNGSPLGTIPGRNSVGIDPLSQTFKVDENGAFLTSVDLFFASKDPTENLTVEIRTTEFGTPTTQLVQDFARAVVSPDQITTSNNGEVATRVTFPSPVFLEPNLEYALVLGVTQSINYEVWISRMGDKTVNTQTLPDAESVVVTKQYVGGSLFKSQNGSIWTASQYEDMKFRLYKANFLSTEGTVFFYNSEMDTRSGNIERLKRNSIKTLPRKLQVGIQTTTHASSILKLGEGVKVSDSTSATAVHGYIERVGGPINTLTITNSGKGFTPSQTYNNVPLFAITGNGSGATATVATNSSGQVSSISITSNVGGNGYAAGDIIGITTSNVTKGSEALITVSSTNGTGMLFLNNVQGEEFTSGQPIVVYEGSTATSYGSTEITSSAIYDAKYEGNVIEVNHFNHGMQADNNLVTLADVEPDTIPVLLTDSLSVDGQTISVASTSEFVTYNGISTSQGYVKINNEIIFYNSIGTNQLGIGTRGVDGTIPRTHDTGDKANKYELNGFDLRCINTDHSMVLMGQEINDLRDMDNYYLSLNRKNLNSGDTQVSFKNESNLGGDNIFASQNYQFDTIIPQFNTLIPSSDVTMGTQIRTVSGTSAGGNEVSFIDQGFENIAIDNENELSTPRLLCSKINETNRLSDLPLNRSVTLGVKLLSNNSNISPVIDIQNGVIIYKRSRLNKPILDYVKDGRSQQSSGDPHSSVYISNQVDLKNPATSLKLLISANRDATADFRAFYQLVRADGTETELSYTAFPGFDNLDDTDGDGFGDRIIDKSKNSGKPDAFVSPSVDDEFKEYQFSVDELEEFIGYKIKIVMNGTNEAKAPRFKDLRTIALA